MTDHESVSLATLAAQIAYVHRFALNASGYSMGAHEAIGALRQTINMQTTLLERIDRQQREIIDRQRRIEQALRLEPFEVEQARGSGD